MSTKQGEQWSWHDVRAWGIEGKGWNKTGRYFDRLPAKAQGKVPPLVWQMSHAPTGMSVLFESDATTIQARWRLTEKTLNEPNMSRAAYSGLDLYTREKGHWRWVGAAHTFTGPRAQATLVAGMAPGWREYQLYLPNRNPVQRLEIGVPPGTQFRPVAPRAAKPIVYYGSSIVHGAYSSRPGLVHPAILGRWLDRPVINLGFSGQAKMDLSVAELLCELDAAVYVIDALPNMDTALVRERALPFLRVLAERRPGTPVVLVDCPFVGHWIIPGAVQAHQEKAQVLRRAWQTCKRAGCTHWQFVGGLQVFGADREGALDGIHPNDLGYMRLAEALAPALRRACRQADGG